MRMSRNSASTGEFLRTRNASAPSFAVSTEVMRGSWDSR